MKKALLLSVLLSSIMSSFGQDGGIWTNTGSLSTARFNHTATLLTNGLVLVSGGYNGGYIAAAELYYPATGTWTNTTSMHTARVTYPATILSNGLVLVAGGQSSSPLTLSSTELYYPTSGTWSNTGSMNNPREYFPATLLASGLVLVSGGWNAITSTGLSGAELYYPTSGTWSNTGSLHSARNLHTSTLLPNGLVLIAGGNNGESTPLASAELYYPATGTWSNTGPMNIARENHTATLLPNGLVLVVGGDDVSGAALASAELFYPATGTWSNTGSLNIARSGHTATMLSNGLVLAAGGDGLSVNGYGPSGDMLTSAEEYDPATGTWSNTGTMRTACYGHTATLLPDGQVLVAAGRTTNTVMLANAELYQTQTCPSYATAIASNVDGFIVGATITETGCGYTNTPLVLIQGGGGTGAGGFAEVTNGMVVGIMITNAGIGYTSTPTIWIGEPPSIVAQPQSVTVDAYDTASFSVAAVGTAQMNYQWSFNSTNLPGATNDSLTISNVVQTNLGSYAVVAANVFGATNSSNAVLSMYPYLNASTGGVLTYWGYTNSLSVGAWGTGPLSYQWYDDGVAIDNATNPSLTFTDIQLTNAGLYSVVVTSPLGSVTNAPEQVVVEPAGVSFGLSPTVTLSGVPGNNYIIQRTPDLSSTNWVTLANVTLTAPVQIWVDTNLDASQPANPHQFYRVLPGQ